jgi:hypothetical protein
MAAVVTHKGKESSKELSLLNVLSDISFCDKQCSNINDNTVKDNIINHIESKFGIQIIEKSFVVLNPFIIKNITYHQHIIATISAGNPYLLWMTKIDGVQCCLFIDRKLKNGYFYPKIHCVRYRFTDDIFNDTILTGELIRDNEKRWMFLLNDILVYQGENMKHHNVITRFNTIYKLLQESYKPDSHVEPCPLQVRKLFMYKDIKNVIDEFIPSLTYPCRGLMFYTLNTKNSNYAYLFSREHEIPLKSHEEIESTFKLKYPELFNIGVSTNSELPSSTPLMDLTPPDIPSLENAFKDIYGDEYKAELFGVKYKSSQVSLDYKPVNIPSLDSIFGEEKDVKESVTESTNINQSQCDDKLESNQMVFRILKTHVPDIYNLYWNEDGNITKQGVAFVSNMKMSKFLLSIFSNSSDSLNINVIAEYNTKHQKWAVIKSTQLAPSMKSSIISIMEELDRKTQLEAV